MDMSLETLLNSVQAGFTKAAAEEKKELPAFMQKKDGDGDGKKNEDADSDKKDEKDSKGEKSESKDSDSKKEDKDDKDGQVKEASEAGAQWAREIMEKVAADKSPVTSVSAGQALAESLLSKQAGVGDQVTEAGVAAGAAVNKSQADLAAQKAESDSTVKLMPTSDGNGPTGSVNQIFDSLVSNMSAKGVTSDLTSGVSAAEGSQVASGVPHQVKVAYMEQLIESGVDFDQALQMTKQAAAEYEDEMEKIAAVNALVEEGVSFDDALDLVKQASDELAAEAGQEAALVKAAALQYMVEQGMDFAEAAELVKQANVGDMITTDGIAPGAVANKSQRDLAAMLAESDHTVTPMPTSDEDGPTGTVNQIFDAMVAKMAPLGASADLTSNVSAAEGSQVATNVPHQVKVAALQKLVSEGVDFEKAASIVKEAGVAAMAKSLAGGAKNMAKAAGGKAKAFAHSDTGAKVIGTAVGAGAGGAALYAAAKPREKKASADIFQEKQAALGMLVEQGVSFAEAAALVEAKSVELYGE